MPVERPKYSTPLILWIFFFCFATSAALLFQKLLLPLIPSLHAGQGLLDGDSIYFHSVAIQLAERIHLEGWAAWSIYPGMGATGNVALLGTLYALFGVEPSLIVPVNAAVHALSGVLVYQISRLIAVGKVGRIAGILAATLFVIFPSALNWYAQVHKDGFAIMAILLVLWSWLWAREKPVSHKASFVLIGGTLTGMLLMIFVRPYNLIPLTAVLVIIFIVLLALDLGELRLRWRKLLLYALSVTIVAGGAIWSRTSGIEEYYVVPDASTTKAITWKKSLWLPPLADSYLAAVAQARARFIASGISIQAGSLIDTHVQPDNAVAVFTYLPRATQIALFAPFPTAWLDKISPARLVSVLETLVWYLIAPGVLFALVYRRSSRLLIMLIFSTLFLCVYGFTIANIGTLYRIRYPYLFMFIIVGLIGWVEYYLRRRSYRLHQDVRRPVRLTSPGSPEISLPSDITHAGIFNAGLIVVALTGITYVSLFLRDVMLARWFGVGVELDAFFIAATIPMFIVAVLSTPLGTMMVPQFLAVRAQYSDTAAQNMVSKILLIYTALTILIALLLLLVAPFLLQLVAVNSADEKIGLSQSLLIWMLPIMILSGVVIVGNAMLNALQRFTVPALAQVTVPIMSIVALIIFGDRLGIMSVIIGMLVGQLINLWIVAVILAKNGFSVRPGWVVGSPPLRSALVQYLPLAAAALSINLVVPLNIIMASTLTDGSAAALGLGNKVVTFITGLVGIAIATVILPHFSSYMARNRLLDVRNELSFFLLAASVITIPVTLLLFEGAEVIVRSAFGGGAFNDNAVEEVARVMRFGVIQLPFFTANLLILKFAIATHYAGRIVIVSLFGLAANIALNIVLMQHSGVAGIALAASIAAALSACLMLLLFNRLGHISWIDLVMVGCNWMLYSTLVICLQYNSQAGVVVAVLALLFLLYGQWNLLVRWRATA